MENRQNVLPIVITGSAMNLNNKHLAREQLYQESRTDSGIENLSIEN